MCNGNVHDDQFSVCWQSGVLLQ